jgi:hypothetical protein
LNVFPEDSLKIIVKLSESVIGFENQKASIRVDDCPVIEIYSNDPLNREFTVIPVKTLILKKISRFTIDNRITDFAGNAADRDEFGFGIPEPAGKQDITFNELLFNPLSGDPDYIEFYNSSQKVLDASRLFIVSVNDEKGDTSSVICVSSEGRCILPGDYYAITTDRQKILEKYFTCDPYQLLEVSALPSMPDNKGHLILFNRELEKIDEVYYDEEMQYSLLQNNEGIAIEKIRPDVASIERLNWHSASESSGWGTPGTTNSVFSTGPVTDDRIIMSSSKITPDSDGIEDFLAIDMNLTGNGNIVSVYVFDETGNFIRKLADNVLAGPHATVIWDGTDQGGRVVMKGIYIMLITVFDETGKKDKWKKVCSVIR